jgi:preprotein translocase subunit SecF
VIETTMAPRRGFLGTVRDIYHERTSFDFIGRSRWWLVLSGTLILISLVALGVRGLNLGIDFEGGSQWDVSVQGKSIDIDEVRSALAGTQAADAKILVLTASDNDSVRVQTDELPQGQRAAVTQALATYAGTQESNVSFVDVGPTWGDQVTRKALTALLFFFVLIAAYLTFRFEWRMAIGAIVAVIHDIIITAGVYAITGFEVTPATVVAFLTILGFSLYDTVVVFDKIRENTPQLTTVKGLTFTAMANRSLNQVLMRSLNTSFVALLPVTSLLVVGVGFEGALALREFGLALFIGLIVGTYSSIFVATPLLVAWKEREPRYRALAERASVRAEREMASVVEDEEAPAAAEAGTGTGTGASAAKPDKPVKPTRAPAPPTAGDAPAITPRPRQQRSKKRR